jgi:hypothetical protein
VALAEFDITIPTDLDGEALQRDADAIRIIAEEFECNKENEYFTHRIEKFDNEEQNFIGAAALGYMDLKLPKKGTILSADIDVFRVEPYFTHSAYLALVKHIITDTGKTGDSRTININGAHDIRLTGVASDLEPFLPDGWQVEYMLHCNERSSLLVPTYDKDDVLDYLSTGKMITHSFRKVS